MHYELFCRYNMLDTITTRNLSFSVFILLLPSYMCLLFWTFYPLCDECVTTQHGRYAKLHTSLSWHVMLCAALDVVHQHPLLSVGIIIECMEAYCMCTVASDITHQLGTRQHWLALISDDKLTRDDTDVQSRKHSFKCCCYNNITADTAALVPLTG